MEKHQMLVTVVGSNVGLQAALELTPPSGHAGDFTVRIAQTWQRLDKEPVVMECPTGTNIQGDMNLTFNVIFGDIEVSKPYTVTDTLQQMADLTGAICRRFEQEFFAVQEN